MAGRTKSNRKTPMMTKDQFNTAIEALALSQIEAGRLLGADTRTVRRWSQGDSVVPLVVESLLCAP
jgi:DNA-binding transcriptional regulator YiaG